MPKNAMYHESAILYNEEFVTFANAMADRVEDAEVKRWCRGIAKQHEFHAGRHKKALDKLLGDDVTDHVTPADSEQIEPGPAQPIDADPRSEQDAEPIDADVETGADDAKEEEAQV